MRAVGGDGVPLYYGLVGPPVTPFSRYGIHCMLPLHSHIMHACSCDPPVCSQPTSASSFRYNAAISYAVSVPGTRLNMDMAGTRQWHMAPGIASQMQPGKTERDVETLAGGVPFKALPFSVLYELRRHVNLSEAPQKYLGSARTLYGRCRIGEKS